MSVNKSISSHLYDLGRELAELIQFTEEEFLGIGEKLQAVSRQAREIAAKSGAAAALMAGQEFTASIDDLRRILNGVEQIGHDTGASKKTLGEMLARIEHCRRLLPGFDRLVLILKILALHTRIESARIHNSDADFSGLSAEVERLALEIKGNTESITEGSAVLQGLVRNTLAKLGELTARQQSETSALVRDTTAGLDSLTRNHERSSEAAAGIAGHYKKVCAGIGEVVQSLQFQDITRQQIEHVREALRDLGGESAAGTPDTVSASIEAVALQAAQLRNTRDTLIAAVTRIIDQLRAIAQQVDRISAVPAELAGSAEQEGGSFLQTARRKLAAVAAALDQYSESSVQVRAAIGQVLPGIERMSGASGQIEGIGFHLGRVALNAQVKTCQVGDDGAALGVLAEKIQELTADTAAGTTGVAENLKFLAAEALELKARFLSGTPGQAKSEGTAGELNSLAAEINARITQLGELNRVVTDNLAAIAGAGRSLHDELEAAFGSVKSHVRAGEVFAHAIESLDAVEMSLRERLPAGYKFQPREAIEPRQDRYTMDSERQVDGRCRVAVPEPAAGPVPAEADASDSGGDVELF